MVVAHDWEGSRGRGRLVEKNTFLNRLDVIVTNDDRLALRTDARGLFFAPTFLSLFTHSLFPFFPRPLLPPRSPFLFSPSLLLLYYSVSFLLFLTSLNPLSPIGHHVMVVGRRGEGDEGDGLT